MQAKTDFRRAEWSNLGLRLHPLGQQIHEPVDGNFGALQHAFMTEVMHQPNVEITFIADLGGFEGFATLVQFIQLPFGKRRIKPRHAASRHGCRACGHYYFQSFKYASSATVFAAVCKPEDSQRQRAIHRCLHLFGIHSNHRPGFWSAHEGTARISGAEAVLQVDCVAEAVKGEVRKSARQHALQQAQILLSRGFSRGWSPRVTIRQSCSVCGLLCPKRRVSMRSTSLRAAMSVTVRTMLRSSDHRCSTQRPCSAERA